MGGADPGAAGFSIATFTAGVPASRIDDAVRRVLRLKFQLGVFETPYGDPVNGPYRLHQPAYTALANQASREAMTLLKNDGVLPMRLNPGDNIVVAGPRATDPNACCIWTSYFHQEYGSLNIIDAIRARAAPGRRERLPGQRPVAEARRGGGRRGVVHARHQLGEGTAVPAGRPARHHPELPQPGHPGRGAARAAPAVRHHRLARPRQRASW